MTDRELLELAAKAAGIEWHCWQDMVRDYDSPHYGGSAIQITHSAITWNPLTDDGDALRLAVKLQFDIGVADGNVCAIPWDMPACIEMWDDNPYVATRRAIVRAAAAIGEGMK